MRTKDRGGGGGGWQAGGLTKEMRGEEGDGGRMGRNLAAGRPFTEDTKSQCQLELKDTKQNQH